MVEIIPAILTDSRDKFKDLVLRIEPHAKRAHIDIADGGFVPNKTVNGHDVIKEIESALKYDIHLMVSKPQDIIKEWFYTHADRFIIHAESDADLGEVIQTLKSEKRSVGLALNPETSADKIEKYLNDTNFVQFMTVHPGFQGGQFVEEVVDKIKSFHEKYPDIMIMCDGAITPETAPKLVAAGASVLVSGSYIIKSEDFGKAIEELKRVTSD
jgi:ribulose-phosphate 3-epimerase